MPDLPLETDESAVVDVPGKLNLRLPGGVVGGIAVAGVLVVLGFWKAGYTLAAPGAGAKGAITREEAAEVVGKLVGEARVDIEKARNTALLYHAAKPHAATEKAINGMSTELQTATLAQVAIREQVAAVKEDVARIESEQHRRFDRVLDKLETIGRDVRRGK